jgi:anti-sigma regulatory factor (Ser/Thr protein kinase)
MTTEPTREVRTMLLDEPFGERDLTALRNAVAAHADRAGVSANRIDDLTLIVAELSANAVRHGGGQGRLRLWVNAHSIVCQVSDDGPGLLIPLPDVRPPATISGGRGLWLVQQYADSIDVTNPPGGGAVITVVIARPT